MMESNSPSKENKICCSICGINVSEKKELQNHMRSHFQLGSYVCVSCEKRFADMNDVNKHIKNEKHMQFRRESNEKTCLLNELLANFFYETNDMDEKEFLESDLYLVNSSHATFLKALNNDPLSKNEMETFLEDIKKPENEELNKQFCRATSFLKLQPQNNDSNVNELDSPSATTTHQLLDIPFSLKKDDNNENVEKDDRVIDQIKFHMKNIKKISNVGYLNLRSLNSKVFRAKHNIKTECLECKKQIPSSKSMIIHIFTEHLKINKSHLLNCFVCFKNHKKTKAFLDFDSVRQHFENNSTLHQNEKFKNNLSQTSDGNEICIFVDRNMKYNVLKSYEMMFKQCFIERGNNQMNQFQNQSNAPDQAKMLSNKQKKRNKRKSCNMLA